MPVVPGSLLTAQTRGTGDPRPATTERARRAPGQVVPDSAERRRLQRLETLADVWAKLELHHPLLQARADLDWDSAFVRAVRRVEAARSTEEFVRALNEELFAPLGDPLSYARTQAQADRVAPASVPGEGLVRPLARGTAYLDLRFGPGDTTRLDVGLIGRVRDGLREHETRHGAPALLVVDLRLQRKEELALEPLLGLWASRPLPTGRRVSRLHRGHYTPTRWQVDPGRPLEPMAPADSAIRTPTVFVVNLASFAALERPLDALQQQSNVAVVLETTGPLTESWDVHTYPEGVRVRLQSPMLVSTDGALGARADTVLTRTIPAAELDRLARAAVRAVAARPARAAFDFPWRPLPRYAVDSAPLSRELRLLGLVRTWKEIGTFSAYLPYASVDMATLLPQWIPQVEASVGTRDYYRTLRRLIALLNDSHASVQHPTVAAPPWTVPALLRRAGEHVLVMRVDSAAVGGQLAVGDEILAVDGVPVRVVEDTVRRYRSASHPGGHHRNVWEYAEGLRGARDTPVRLTVTGPRGPRDVTLRRTATWQSVALGPVPGEAAVRRLPGNVGYIAMHQLRDAAALDSALGALAETDALVLDHRRNVPQWLWANHDIRYVLVSRFLSAPVVSPGGGVHAVSMHGGQPARALEARETVYVPYESPGGVRYTKPLAILIGARNQSAGESVVWPLELAGRALFVGEPTAGTNGGAPEFTIPGGGAVIFTHERVTYPGGERFHGVGIVPDVLVVPTPAGVRAGRDEVLERAVEALRAGLVRR